MQPQLRHLLDLVTKIIVDNEKGKPWSSLSLLYGYCTLCESCANEGTYVRVKMTTLKREDHMCSNLPTSRKPSSKGG